jgi:hypothetical protein
MFILKAYFILKYKGGILITLLHSSAPSTKEQRLIRLKIMFLGQNPAQCVVI